MGKLKLLYIMEHCSTGGMPQYTLKQIETFKDQFDIEVVELKFYGDAYVVQRNKIQDLVPFHALHGKLNKLQSLVDYIKPDIIHIQENPISIMDNDTAQKLFNHSRDYFILATSHSSYTQGTDFRFRPDRIIAVNRWQQQLFQKQVPDIEVRLWEYPIENKKPTPEQKWEAKVKLGIVPMGTSGCTPRHILNVGLFTPGKNQGELFEIARKKMMDRDECSYTYHFVGNQAENFREYWEPLMRDKPSNCRVWGEKDNMDLFYTACDEMIFTSKLELNPICIKEALSYGLPVKMYKLPTYLDDYDNNQLVTYL